MNDLKDIMFEYKIGVKTFKKGKDIINFNYWMKFKTEILLNQKEKRN